MFKVNIFESDNQSNLKKKIIISIISNNNKINTKIKTNMRGKQANAQSMVPQKDFS